MAQREREREREREGQREGQRGREREKGERSMTDDSYGGLVIYFKNISLN